MIATGVDVIGSCCFEEGYLGKTPHFAFFIWRWRTHIRANWIFYLCRVTICFGHNENFKRQQTFLTLRDWCGIVQRRYLHNDMGQIGADVLLGVYTCHTQYKCDNIYTCLMCIFLKIQTATLIAQVETFSSDTEMNLHWQGPRIFVRRGWGVSEAWLWKGRESNLHPNAHCFCCKLPLLDSLSTKRYLQRKLKPNVT